MKPYTFFNFICVFGCVFFVGASFFVWGRFTSKGDRTELDIVAVRFEEFKKEDIGNKKLEIGEVEIGNEEIEGSNEEGTVSSSESVVEESIVEGVVEKTPLPASFNLAVPFTSQAPEKNWDQPWQDACEEAAILMLDAYYKEYNVSPLFAKDELLKMIAFEEENGWGGSIEIEKVQQVAEFYMDFGNEKWGNGEINGLQIVENPTIEQIKRLVSKGHPVYVVAYGKELPNPHFVNGGPEYHALVIRGYTDTTFITNDPGTQFGENFEYNYNELMNAIADWNGGNPKEGRSVIMVMK